MADTTTTKMTVYIPKQLHIDAKVHAAQTEQSISAVVEKALVDYLARQKAPAQEAD